MEEIRQYNSIMKTFSTCQARRRSASSSRTARSASTGKRPSRKRSQATGISSGWRQTPYRAAWRSLSGKASAGKARKLKSRVEKMKMEGWDWLDKLIAGAKAGDDDKSVGIKPLDKYLRDLIGGRRFLRTLCGKGASGSGTGDPGIPGLPLPGCIPPLSMCSVSSSPRAHR